MLYWMLFVFNNLLLNKYKNKSNYIIKFLLPSYPTVCMVFWPWPSSDRWHYINVSIFLIVHYFFGCQINCLRYIIMSIGLISIVSNCSKWPISQFQIHSFSLRPSIFIGCITRKVKGMILIMETIVKSCNFFWQEHFWFHSLLCCSSLVSPWYSWSCPWVSMLALGSWGCGEHPPYFKVSEVVLVY